MKNNYQGNCIVNETIIINPIIKITKDKESYIEFDSPQCNGKPFKLFQDKCGYDIVLNMIKNNIYELKVNLIWKPVVNSKNISTYNKAIKIEKI